MPQHVAQVWHDIHEALRDQPAFVHATPSLGIVRVILPASADAAAIERLAQIGATVIYERLRSDLWQSLSPSVVSDRISQRVKEAFDPFNLLNPGILGPKL
jgi:hypothetical protein